MFFFFFDIFSIITSSNKENEDATQDQPRSVHHCGSLSIIIEPIAIEEKPKHDKQYES